MSFDALAWAAKQNPGSSGTKLVLLGLAECADRSHALAFPSIAALVEFCCLDRKSVIANLAKLEAAGFISDTGRRVGATKQIKVFKLNLESIPNPEQSQKRNSSDFSGKGPKNGTRNQSEPGSVAKATVAEATDPVKGIFDLGVNLLVEAGTEPRQARSIVGKWRKDHGDELVMTAFVQCRTKGIAEPVEWLTKRFQAKARYVSASGYEYRGGPEEVVREAERRADWDTYWKAKGDLTRAAA